jgi:hypothetical protein
MVVLDIPLNPSMDNWVMLLVTLVKHVQSLVILVM